MPSALDADRPRFRPVYCDSCGAPLKLTSIVYGYPDDATLQATERGEVVLGGCLVGDGTDPIFACAACQAPVSRRPT